MTKNDRWEVSRQINSASDLSELLKEVAEAVRVGDLIQITPNDAPWVTKKGIADILPDGPWGDYLELYFQDSQSGRRYKLSAETFHGQGGSWKPVPLAPLWSSGQEGCDG